MVVDNEENVCCKCGVVEIPSYDDQEHEQLALESLKSKTRIDCIDKQGYIIEKATELDYSNGGFLSTKIDNRNSDFTGKRINRQHFNKMRFINNYILSSTGMSTYKNAVWSIDSICGRLQVPHHVKERSAEIFKKVYISKTNIHNSKKVVCACIYFTCLEADVNRKMEDIALAAHEGVKYASDISKVYQKLSLEWLPSLPKVQKPGLQKEIIFMGRRMGLPEKVTRNASNIYNQIRKKHRIFFSGKSLKITSALLLYIAALQYQRENVNVRIKPKKFAEAAGTGDKNDKKGITEYVLKRRAIAYLENPVFLQWKELKTFII